MGGDVNHGGGVGGGARGNRCLHNIIDECHSFRSHSSSSTSGV